MARVSSRPFLLFLVPVLLIMPFASAQAFTTGNLTGTVTDQKGGVIPRAEIVAKNDHTGEAFRAITNETGVWLISSVPTGSYAVSITAPGFRTATFKAVEVGTGISTTVDAILLVGFADTFTVTASKVEQEVINAPATVTVIPQYAIRLSPSRNVADLLRTVPGMNVIQTSAYGFFTNSRAAAGLYSDAQLGLVDGRTMYLDYLGALDWGTVTADLDEVKQVEVIRGPASAVWGAYAMNGVINIITTPPREMIGTTLTLGAGAFDRSGGAAESNTGSLFYAKIAHAQVLNDRWAYKITSSVSTQDPFARPVGRLPNPSQTPYPIYPNRGVTGSKLDGRVDYDLPDGKRHFTFAGGAVSFPGGTAITTLGPLDCRVCVLSYGKVDYVRGALRITGFVNAVTVDSPFVEVKDREGQPLPWRGDTQVYDIGFSNSQIVAAKHLVSYGANYRHNQFNHSAIPEVTSRDDGGAYFQDEFLLSEHFRWVFGARLDKFENLESAVLSPRTTFLVKPAKGQTVRMSYNRAYVAPSAVSNHVRLDYRIPYYDAGSGRYIPVTISVEGNPELKEKSVDAYEIGHTASLIENRVNVGVAFYVNASKGQIYGARVRPDLVRNANLGKVRNKGLELSVEGQISRFVNAYANYSRQAKPVPDSQLDIPYYNQPPAHRFNAGSTFDYKRYFGNVSVGYVGSAVWNDILPWWGGPTEGYTTVNLTAGKQWGGNRRYTAMLKVSNLANARIQNHVFGDILKRQVAGELRIRF